MMNEVHLQPANQIDDYFNFMKFLAADDMIRSILTSEPILLHYFVAQKILEVSICLYIFFSHYTFYFFFGLISVRFN